MTDSGPTLGSSKYYDPDEVEAYINDATTTIKALQARLRDATRRADEADPAAGDHPETASLGRALLLASEVADQTIANADARAAEVMRAADAQALEILDAAHSEADRVTEAARAAAADVFHDSEARLLAAVSAFVEGSEILRDELAKVKQDATSRRSQPGARPDMAVPRSWGSDPVDPLSTVSPLRPPTAYRDSSLGNRVTEEPRRTATPAAKWSPPTGPPIARSDPRASANGAEVPPAGPPRATGTHPSSDQL